MHENSVMAFGWGSWALSGEGVDREQQHTQIIITKSNSE